MSRHEVCSCISEWSISANEISGSPAGLSRVNGVRRSSAKTRNFNPSPKSQFDFNRFDIWRG